MEQSVSDVRHKNKINIFLMRSLITALLGPDAEEHTKNVLRISSVHDLLDPLLNKHRIHILIEDGWINIDDRLQFKLLSTTPARMELIVNKLANELYLRTYIKVHKYTRLGDVYSEITAEQFVAYLLPHFDFVASTTEPKRKRELHITINNSGLLLEAFDNTPRAEPCEVPKPQDFKLIGTSL